MRLTAPSAEIMVTLLSDRVKPIVYPDDCIAIANNLPNKHKYITLPEGEVDLAVLRLSDEALAFFACFIVHA